MEVSRRLFLQGAAAIAGGLALTAMAGPIKASAQTESFPGNPDRFGMLTDTTLCIGCRLCETACNEAHGLPPPEAPPMDQAVFDVERRPTTKQWTVVNKFNPEEVDVPVYRKAQCMHCNEPACVSVCPVAAIKKTKEGAVIYDDRLCIGCRYCMAACPYTMLTYSYDSATGPKILKCVMCHERVVERKIPACAEVCPTKATIFGKRNDLVEQAHHRIADNPDKYVPHVFGETEAGGGSWLYLAAVPFERLALPTGLGTTPFPEFSRDWLLGVPLVITMWPAVLMGIRYMTNHRNGGDESEKAAEQKTEVTK